jgi:hypothetical protein
VANSVPSSDIAHVDRRKVALHLAILAISKNKVAVEEPDVAPPTATFGRHGRDRPYRTALPSGSCCYYCPLLPVDQTVRCDVAYQTSMHMICCLFVWWTALPRRHPPLSCVRTERCVALGGMFRRAQHTLDVIIGLAEPPCACASVRRQGDRGHGSLRQPPTEL